MLHPAADRAAEDDEIEAGGDHRRRHRLPQRAQRPRHLVAIDRPDAVPVDRGGGGHAACSWRSWTRSTKIDRKRVVKGKRVSVRVDLGGTRIIKYKKKD